jgi:hypothetical protein
MLVSIPPLSFSIPDPYFSGQTIDQDEADILNEIYFARLSRGVSRHLDKGSPKKVLETYIKNFSIGNARTSLTIETDKQRLARQILEQGL